MQPLTIHRYGSPDAPPLVLVHGVTDAGTNWPDLVEHWGDRWDIRQELLHNDLLSTVVIRDSGHCVRRDQPERYYRAVDAFLDETLRRRRDAVDRP